ncbi:MAG: STAS domain-containing protein, partial [Actinomycetota bacterium]
SSSRRRNAAELTGPTMSSFPPSCLYPVMTGNEARQLVLSDPITPDDIPGLCERARVLLDKTGHDPVVCDVGALAEPDAVMVDALARLQLTARRLGRRLRFRGACGELLDLLAFVGLGDTLPCGPASVLEPRRKPEEREQALGVEEEADPGDLPV